MPTTARINAENKIYNLMDALDSSKYNSEYYKEYFKTLNDTAFTEYMRRLRDDDTFYLFFEINSLDFKGTPDISRIKDIAEEFGVQLTEYVMFPNKSKDLDNPAVTATPIPVLIVQVRRLQQLLEKKNAASSNIDKVNPITGQVTGESKAASLSDMQTMSLVTSGQIKTIKEFLGPRADDNDAKMKMLDMIERTGEFNIDDININTENKQSVNTMKVFLQGAGFKVKFGNSGKK